MVVISVDIPAGNGRLSEPKQPVVRPECRIAPGNHRFDTARIRPGLPSMVLQSAGGSCTPRFDHQASRESAF